MKLACGYADIGSVDEFVSRLDRIGAEFGCAVTAFDARYVAGRAHVETAVERANRAFRRDDAIADDRGIEILLYAAGRRQIEQALEMGVSGGRGPVVVVVDGGVDGSTEPTEGGSEGAVGVHADESSARDAASALIDPAAVIGTERDEERIRAFFDITDREFGATDASLEALVIERVSLLVIEK